MSQSHPKPLVYLLTAVVVFLVFAACYVSVRCSEDWAAWASSDAGILGLAAGCVSSVLAVLFAGILTHSTRACLNALRSPALKNAIEPELTKARQSRLRYVFGVPIVVLYIAASTAFWIRGTVPFKTATWLIECWIGMAVNVLVLVALWVHSLKLDWVFVAQDPVKAVFNPLDGKSARDLNRLFNLTSTGAAFCILAYVPWSYALFALGLNADQRLASVLTTSVVTVLVVGPYVAALYRLHSLLLDARDHVLDSIQAEIGDIVRETVDGRPSTASRERIEVLQLLRANAKGLPTWPFSLENWIKLLLPFTISFAPSLKILITAVR